MQIDTDLSPVVSPNSNISNSFASQRDVILFGLNSNRTNRHLSDNQPFDFQNLRVDSTTNKTGVEVNFPVQNNQNNTVTTTNESYSMEKYTYLESLNKDQVYENMSNGLIIPEHSTDRELNHEDDSNRSQIQNMHILEYEEFITGGDPKLSSRSKGSDSLGSSKESDRVDRDQQETKRKQQAQYFSENLLQMVEPSDRANEHNNFATVIPQAEEITFRRPGMKKKLELQINDDDNAATGTVANKNSQQEETKKEHAEVSKPNPFFLKGFPPVKESKQEKDAPSFGTSNEMIAHNRKDEENEILVKENSTLKQEIRRMSKDLKDLNIENLRLREEVDDKGEIILREQEKFDHIQSIGKNAKTKDNETIAHLEEENRLLREKERRYRESLLEKDDINENLRRQCEELSRTANHQQLYEALAEKIRGFEDNTIQLTKEVEDQREQLKAKDDTIESLLLRMDNLAQTVTSKNNEMILLRAEITSLKDELLAVVKSGNEPRPEAKSVGSLYSRIREKDKGTYSPEKKEEVSEQRSFTPVGSNYTYSERKEGRPLSSTQKSEVNLHKNYFQAYATRSDKSPDEQGSRSGHWSSMKWNILNNKTRGEQESQPKEQHKKATNKSIDLHSKSKTDPKKTSQNIEDLQKRLAYLKHKRLEFEKQKNSAGSSKETSTAQTVRKSSIPETSPVPIFKTSLKTQDVVSPVRNIPVGNFQEPTSDLSSEHRRKEQSSRASPMFESSSRSSLLYKSIQVGQEPNINEELKSMRTSLTTKPRFQPKIDNFLTNNPAYQANDDFKVVPRYNSFANIPTTQGSKSVEAKGNKTVKRHSDLNSYTRASEIRSITEAALNKHRVEYLG